MEGDQKTTKQKIATLWRAGWARLSGWLAWRIAFLSDFPCVFSSFVQKWQKTRKVSKQTKEAKDWKPNPCKEHGRRPNKQKTKICHTLRGLGSGVRDCMDNYVFLFVTFHAFCLFFVFIFDFFGFVVTFLFFLAHFEQKIVKPVGSDLPVVSFSLGAQA